MGNKQRISAFPATSRTPSTAPLTSPGTPTRNAAALIRNGRFNQESRKPAADSIPPFLIQTSSSAPITSHFSPGTSHPALLTPALLTRHFSPGTSHSALLTRHFSLGTSHSALLTRHFSLGTSHPLPTAHPALPQATPPATSALESATFSRLAFCHGIKRLIQRPARHAPLEGEAARPFHW
jgi:hypothetical protein